MSSMVVQRKYGRHTFEYGYAGLYQGGYTFESDLSHYLPRFFKDGRTVNSSRRTLQSMPPAFWKAQCRFRGIDDKGATSQLQQRLTNAPNILAMELLVLEQELKTEWKTKHEADMAMERLQEEADSRAQKARAITDLKKMFPEGPSTSKVVVIEDYDDDYLKLGTQELGLWHCEITNPFLFVDWKRGRSTWLIIGTDREICAAKAEELHAAGRKKVKQIMDQADNERWLREAEEELKQKAAARAAPQGSQVGDHWDVTGKYSITCEAMIKEYGGGYDDPMTLKISRVEDPVPGNAQMFAKFKFNLLEGYLRFETQDQNYARDKSLIWREKQKYSRAQRKADYGYSDDSEGEPDPEMFLLRIHERPSESNPTWHFRWRGCETREGEYQYGSEEELCSMTFSGWGGTKLRGVLRTDYGNFEFTGIRTKFYSPGEGVPYWRVHEQWKEWSSKKW